MSFFGKHSRIKTQIFLVVSDFFSFFFAFMFSWCLIRSFGEKNPDFISWMNSDPGQARIWLSLIFSLISILWFYFNLQHYSRRKPFWSELKEIVYVVISLSILDLVVTALEKWQLSRTYWLSLWLITIVLIPSFRFLTKKMLNRFGCWQLASVIVGCGENAKDAWFALHSEQLMGFNILGFIPTKSDSNTPINDVPLINESLDNLVREVSNLKIFIAVEHDEHDIVDYYLRILTKLRVNDFEVIPSIRGIPLYGSDISHFFSHEVLLIQIKSNLSSIVSRAIKRIFDVIVSTCLILFLSPIYVFIAFKISRDGGPAIYSHERIGFQGCRFNCLKFQSMVLNSNDVLQEILDKNSDARDEWNKDFKLKNDPRITKVGNFLRRTSLDELPQLWNVLKGDMSLVGPRPVVAEELSRYGDDVDYYLMAKPGMTGLWQVSGRNDTDYETRVYLDVWYVKNWSLWYDIAILFKTINVVLKSDGAY